MFKIAKHFEQCSLKYVSLYFNCYFPPISLFLEVLHAPNLSNVCVCVSQFSATAVFCFAVKVCYFSICCVL